ncbi:MAG: hypothetical protein P8M34_05455 [Saprospiraceae bacterium]|nr:hypothetical protein [Saprospiraceae bacterium]
MFSEEEGNAIITAEQIISRNKDGSLVQKYQSAVEKTKAVLSGTQLIKSELLTNKIQIRSNFENEKTSSFLIQLQKAIIHIQVSDIVYLSL